MEKEKIENNTNKPDKKDLEWLIDMKVVEKLDWLVTQLGFEYISKITKQWDKEFHKEYAENSHNNKEGWDYKVKQAGHLNSKIILLYNLLKEKEK